MNAFLPDQEQYHASLEGKKSILKTHILSNIYSEQKDIPRGSI